MICILCARVGKKTLLTETHKSTQSQSQHLKRLHTEKWELIQSDSLNSVNSSVQVKLCKETNAIALAEAIFQGTLDDFFEKKPAFRMSSGDKKKIDDDLALYLLQYNRPNNMVNDYHFKVR